MDNDNNVTLHDIAHASGLSVSTVHRALHGIEGVNAIKRARVLQVAKSLGYRPNLAARYLRSKRHLRISVNTPREIASFYDSVRAGIADEAAPSSISGLEVFHRTFPRLGVEEEAAFEAALDDKVDGIIVVSGHLANLGPWIRRAARLRIPVVCLVNDGPGADKLTAVSVDTIASGALVGELMGRFLQGKGSVVVTSGDLAVANHREKVDAFQSTLRSLYPDISFFPTIQNHESEIEAYERMLEFLSRNQHLDGLYVSTGNGAPVLRAVEDAGLFGKVQIITTSLYPALVPAISQGQVAASIYERPYSQGRIAFRILHDFLVEGRCPAARVTLAPLLIMKSNLNRFLEQEYIGTEKGRSAASDDAEALSVAGSVKTSFEYV